MKRSSQVALLLMGATGMGAGAFAFSSPSNCPAALPAVTAPGVSGVPAAQPCSPRSTSSGSRFYSSHWSRPIFTRTSTTPSGVTGPSARTSVPSSTTTSGTRGGFGTIGHSISSSS